MNPLCSALRPVLLALACAAMTACANSPPQRTEMDYRSRPGSTARAAPANADPSDRRLTIQSGEGERLNLPWFIRDTQEWINNN